MATISYTGGGQTGGGQTGGGQAGNWTDPANWKGGKAPGVSDTAIVFGTANQTVGSVDINSVMLFGSQTVTFTGVVTTPGVGNCKGLMVCDGATAVFAPGASLVDGGVLQAGVNGVGTLLATGSASAATMLSAKSFTLGKAVPGNGTATLDNASLAVATGAVIGQEGVGTLNLSDGATLTTGAGFWIGHSAGATGSVTLSSGAAITVGGSAAVGEAGTGTLTVNSGASFTVHGGLAVSADSVITLAGGTVTGGNVAVLRGGLISGNGALTAGNVSDNGSIVASGGTLAIAGKLTGGGTLTIDAGSTASITGSTVGLQHLAFAGAGGTLALAGGASVQGTIAGFGAGDLITMAGVTAAALNSKTDVLTLSNAGQTVDTLHLTGAYAGDVFAVSQSHGVGVITVHAG